MKQADQMQLKKLCENVLYQSKEMQELKQFVCDHKGEFIGGPDAERAVDDFALLTGWIYDTLEGRKYDDKHSKNRKMKKALGYTVC